MSMTKIFTIILKKTKVKKNYLNEFFFGQLVGKISNSSLVYQCLLDFSKIILSSLFYTD